MKKLVILMGLPASGKSTFAKEYHDKNNQISYNKGYYVDVIDIDQLKEYHKDDNTFSTEKIIRREIKKSHSDEVLIDGLFLNTNDIIKVIDIVLQYRKVSKIEIHYWVPDINKCLWNDKYRRNKSSEITIKNAVFEEPKIEQIKNTYENIEVKVMKHNIVAKPNWKVFADKYNIKVNEYGDMDSKGDSWCLGGTWGNCWGDSGEVSAEAQPTSYVEFDDLLTKVCPNISFLQYKKLYNNSVSTDTYNENDYYGGNSEYGYFVCNIPKLYDMLVEMNLIDESNF